MQPDSLHCTQQLGHHVLTLQALPCVPQLLPEGLHCAGGFSTLQQKVLKALPCSNEHTFWAESQQAADLKCQRQQPPTPDSDQGLATQVQGQCRSVS